MSNKLEHERELNVLKARHLEEIGKCAQEYTNQGLVVEKHKKQNAKLLKQVGELQARVSAAEKVDPTVVRERDQALAAVRALQDEVQKANDSRRKAQESQDLAEKVNKEMAADLDNADKITEEFRAKVVKLEEKLYGQKQEAKEAVTVCPA